MIQIYTAIITPFRADGEIDYDLIADLISWQARSKIDGLVVCGTNGEFKSLSFEEVQDLMKFTIEHRKGGLEIVAGTGRSSLKETIALCKFAEGGADKALVVPPFYFKDLNFQGIYNFFKELLENTSIPIILYNIPKYTGVEITPDLVNRLKNYNNLYGIKDSSGKLETTENFINACPNLSVYAGSDALIQVSFEKGAVGAISSISNIFPDLILEIKNQVLKGNSKGARAAQERILEIRGILKQFPNKGAIKAALSLLGFPISFVRPPLVNLTAEQEEKLRDKLSVYLSNKNF
ncbi:MAG: 4-hydroxy-tetrahydrodipicolinate synthase [Candidatus Helarchaeota archaeon]